MKYSGRRQSSRAKSGSRTANKTSLLSNHNLRVKSPNLLYKADDRGIARTNSFDMAGVNNKKTDLEIV